MPQPTKRLAMSVLAGTLLLHLVLSYFGIAWGLPTRADDAFLFPDGHVWPGTKIASLLETVSRVDPDRGAEVDLNPIAGQPGGILLNTNETDQAEIFRRYRLYTAQPDEMTVMMALSGMRPAQFQLDPKLYQYGGLFLYPVGGVIAAGGAFGLIDLHGDSTPYLDAPEDFGRFYVAARGLVAAWGLLGAIAVYGIASVLAGRTAGMIAALLFALLPVVVCMSHEAKPHLPGAVLMLCAVYCAMQALRRQRNRYWAGLFVCCGAAVGTVLSSGPILILVPLTVAMHCRQQTLRQRNEGACSRRAVDYRPIFLRATAGGLMAAGLVYAVTNPYLVINLFVNREVLRSSFGNSLAMYEISRVSDGLIRVLQLTVEGATLPVLVIGLIATVAALIARKEIALPLIIPATLFAFQFILIGAGKPDEYGRFGIFYEAALAIGAACLLGGGHPARLLKSGGEHPARLHESGGKHPARLLPARRLRSTRIVITALLLAWCALRSAPYLCSLHADATGQGSRSIAAEKLQAALASLPANDRSIAAIADPAPYACPPIDFANTPVVLYKLSDSQPAVDRIKEWNEMLTAEPQQSAIKPPKIMVAAIDDPAEILRRIPQPAWTQMKVCESRPWNLPRSRISWANKPIVILIAK